MLRKETARARAVTEAGAKVRARVAEEQQPFTGNCHICDQPSHMAGDRTNKGLRHVEGGDKFKPWQQDSLNSHVALCVTNQLFASYREN